MNYQGSTQQLLANLRPAWLDWGDSPGCDPHDTVGSMPQSLGTKHVSPHSRSVGWGAQSVQPHINVTYGKGLREPERELQSTRIDFMRVFRPRSHTGDSSAQSYTVLWLRDAIYCPSDAIYQSVKSHVDGP